MNLVKEKVNIGLNFFASKDSDIATPTGKDAVNFRKLLFLPLVESKLILSIKQWKRIDLRCLQLLNKKMLRASCMARDVESFGGKTALVERLKASFERQRTREIKFRQRQAEEVERKRNLQGGVWAFGAGYCGQLGHGDTEFQAKPILIKRLRGLGVCKVFAGFDSDVSFALTKKGEVFVWGNRQGPTGLPESLNLQQMYQQAKQLQNYEDDEDEENDDEESASSDEEDHSHVPEEQADILHPVLLGSLVGEEVDEIAVGRVHCAAITHGGDVFTWGENDHTQLGKETVHSVSEKLTKKNRTNYGTGTRLPNIWKRTIPQEKEASSIIVGTSHTMVILEDNTMVSLGGTFNTGDSSSLARCISKMIVMEVSCGATHAGILTDEGKIYTWGSGDGGRLGHGDYASCATPTLVKPLENEIVVSISCGFWHTAAIILVPPLLKGGFVYTWGSGRQGQLGLGGIQIAPLPTIVEDLLVAHVVVKKIHTGMYHNIAVSADDEAFTWGSNINGCLGRPRELNDSEEEFCAVPGKVENMQAFVGKICSVACGRNYTLIATRPYVGLSKVAMARKAKEQEEKEQALLRAEQVEADRLAALQHKMETEIVIYVIEVLNETYLLCSQCKIEKGCPGFQRDQARPKLCKHCLHDRRKHDAHRKLEGNEHLYTYEYILEVMTILEVKLNFSSIRAKYPELLA